MEGDVLGYSLKKECGWINTMEVYFGGNWVCARDGPWRFHGKFPIWILVGRCSGVFCWKFPDINLYVRLDIKLHPVLELGVGSSLEY